MIWSFLKIQSVNFYILFSELLLLLLYYVSSLLFPLLAIYCIFSFYVFCTPNLHFNGSIEVSPDGSIPFLFLWLLLI